MIIEGKNAVVYGGGGKVGSMVARAFAREGARVFLTGRTLETLERTAEMIRAAGGTAETAEVDALAPEAVDDHVKAIVEQFGHLDVSFNAIWIRGELQGTSLLEMPVANFTAPVMTAIESNFLTATAAARQMVKQGSGAILTLSTSSAGLSGRDRRFHKTGGQSTATSAVEAFTRSLAGEVGPQGVRVICLRPDALPETWGEHLEGEPKGDVWRYMEDGTALGRLPALAEVGNAAVFAASDWAGAMTGTVFNLTCGSIMD